MTHDTTYNGWTNYATWRINLEIFDGFSLKDNFDTVPSVNELSDYLKEYLEDALEAEAMGNPLVLSYALAFVAEVNFYEIAQRLVQYHAEINA